MSRSLNRVSLIGNLGADPEVRATGTGNRVATFSLATSRAWNDSAGVRQEKTEWHRCVVWNTKNAQLADVAEKYLHKGDRIHVDGRIEYKQWTDKENQVKYSTEINVRELLMLGSPRGDAEGTNGARPKVRVLAGAGAGSVAGGEDFEDFPGALSDEEDDLPF
ncbi:MAG: single-stranded DNA-binding protein [Gemmatimonadaceae bacterium]